MTAPRASSQDENAVAWLLRCPEPAVRVLTRRDVIGEQARPDPKELLQGSWMRALLADQRADGGFGVHPYSKWTGGHWRLVSLVELGVPAGCSQACAAADTVLDWLTGARHRADVRVVNGLVRVHASQEGNALAVASRLGMAGDSRVRELAESLLAWQWPDGGWNCDRRSEGRCSSFHETLTPMWGLHEFAAATGDLEARRAAHRAADLLLERRLFRSLRTGRVIDSTWRRLRYPPYWHYGILPALLVLGRMGRSADPLAAEALDIVEGSRLPDGTWAADGAWWRPSTSGRGMRDVVDWGSTGSDVMVTLDALRSLRAAGRLESLADGH